MARKAPTGKGKGAGGGASLDASMRVVALHGKEYALKREKLDELREALRAEHGEVEVHDLDGATAQLAEVLDELRGYSMLGRYKLVIVDEADAFLKTHREPIERYAKNPVDHATLVLRSEAWNRGNLDKLIAKVGAVVKCDPPSAADAAKWLMERATAEHGRAIERDAAAALVERLGPDMMRLESELAKLAVTGDAAGNMEGPMTRAMVEASVGRSSEEKAWAVQEAVLTALLERRAGGAIAKVHELIDVAGNDAVPVTWAVADLMRKLAVGASMREAGVPEGVIVKRLKLWGPSAASVSRLWRVLGAREAAGLLHRALELDARSKSGLGDAVGNLETFCVQMVDEVGGARSS